MKGRTPTRYEKHIHDRMASEEWKDIPGYGDLYEASSLGRIRSKARDVAKRTRYGGMMIQHYDSRVLEPSTQKGYVRLHIGFGGRKVSVWAHTLVLKAFKGEPLEGQICRHLNGIPDDNRPENLCWGTHLENMSDRSRHGHYASGASHVMAKLDAEQVAFIRGSRLTGVEISAMFGIGQSQISRIRRGESWKEAICA